MMARSPSTNAGRRLGRVAALAALAALAAASSANAQNSSLVRQYQREPGSPLTLGASSPYFVPVDPPRKIKLHDIVTVVVRISSQVVSEGEAEVRRNINFNAVLQDWIGLDGFAVRPDPQSAGDPAITAQANNRFRATSEVETADSIQFTIAAEVVDIRPNNVLVLEASQEVANNDETWTRKLIGEARAEDILPNNTIQSNNLANLRISKVETGAVRDGYKRGWLAKLWDHVAPF